MLNGRASKANGQVFSYFWIHSPESQCHFMLMHLPLAQLNWLRASQVGNAVSRKKDREKRSPRCLNLVQYITVSLIHWRREAIFHLALKNCKRSLSWHRLPCHANRFNLEALLSSGNFIISCKFGGELKSVTNLLQRTAFFF